MSYVSQLFIEVFNDSTLTFVHLSMISILTSSFLIPLNSLKFEWVNSHYQVLNFLLLAPIGYVITSTISSNIALSLGMVGALSIIRFRTPVKNSFELVVYFLLLTIGITASVELSLSIILTIFVHVILWIFRFITYLNPKFNIFEFSNKSEHKNFLTISSTQTLEYENFNLISLNYSENIYEYTIAGSKQELINFQNKLIESNKNGIEKINSTFYS